MNWPIVGRPASVGSKSFPSYINVPILRSETVGRHSIEHTIHEAMHISSVVPQLRTTDLAASVHFYTTTLGFTLEFLYDDFYAGVRSGEHVVHLKLIDAPDPSIAFVDQGEHFHLYFGTDDVARVADALKDHGVPLVQDVHDTAWGTRECVIKDNAGHTLYFGERR